MHTLHMEVLLAASLSIGPSWPVRRTAAADERRGSKG